MRDLVRPDQKDSGWADNMHRVLKESMDEEEAQRLLLSLVMVPEAELYHLKKVRQIEALGLDSINWGLIFLDVYLE